MFRKLAILLLLAIVQAHALTFKETRRASKIRLNALTLSTAESVAHYVTTCAALVDKTLATDGTPEDYIDLEETGISEPIPTDSNGKIYFNENTELQVFTFRILRALIQRRQRELFGTNKPLSELTDFLAAALTFRRITSMVSAGSNADWDYSAARRQFEMNSFPNAEILLCKPIHPLHTLFFQLYAMHSEILLKALEQLPQKRGTVLKSLLEMEAFGREATESVRYVLSNALPMGMPLQAWYERHAIHNSSRNHATDAPSNLSEQVAALESINLLSAGNNGNLVQVRIDEIPDALSDLKLDKAALTRRQNQFLELRNESSPLLRPSLELYAKALGYLASHDFKRFKTTITQARNDFHVALEKQQRISDALARAETEFVPATKRLGNYLEALKHYQKNKENILHLESP